MRSALPHDLSHNLIRYIQNIDHFQMLAMQAGHAIDENDVFVHNG
jgi:hypothetical protein